MLYKGRKNIIITAALPYANFDMHLGHLFSTFLLADIAKRVLTKFGYKVMLISGSDCFGTPVVISSLRLKKTCRKIVHMFHTNNYNNLKKFSINLDFFGKTSSREHVKFVQNFFKKQPYKIQKVSEVSNFCLQDMIYLPERLTRLYCTNCLHDVDFDEGCAKNHIIEQYCSLCGGRTVLRESGIFKMLFESKYIEKFLEGTKFNTISNKLICEFKSKQQLSTSWKAITRQMNWGVRFNSEQVFYVWFEALISYLSMSRGMWNKSYRIQFMGKDNLFFHAYMLPCIVRRRNLLPNEVNTSFFLRGERKFSKSNNYGVFLKDIPKSLVSLIRLYLVSIYNTSTDSVFQKDGLKLYAKQIFVNQIINSFQRTSALLSCGNYIFERHQNNFFTHILNQNIPSAYEQFMTYVRDIGTHIQSNKLWEEKSDPAEVANLLAKLYLVYECLEVLAPDVCILISKQVQFYSSCVAVVRKSRRTIVNLQQLLNQLDTCIT